ncbi:hypothetical protein HPB47_023263 [Ixodes persulcatus]|uniref:Uncharacterized protein n=1 Tax=Ixodes persulcatus TaxID=34615 RepID=A0AC60QAV0_IXOPE|nr:hypothetical protein HPB47_023263 [Ixodes persulcatus]
MMSKQEGKTHQAPSQARKEPNSWSQAIYDAVVTADDNGNLNLSVDGGSDRGDFAYFSCVNSEKANFLSGRIEDGDTILEIQGHRVAGYTRNDVLSLLSYSARNDSAVSVRGVRAGYLTKDLRQYLNTRFQKGSIDHDLQNTIRDNLYLRTVPWNHYGTPRPQEEGPFPALLPGAHPSSEGKRRRNRSNVEAMTAKSVAQDPPHGTLQDARNGGHAPQGDGPAHNSQGNNSRCSTPASVVHTNGGGVGAPREQGNSSFDLEPLPAYWEKAYTEDGEPYFINHVNRRTQYESPLPHTKMQTSPSSLGGPAPGNGSLGGTLPLRPSSPQPTRQSPGGAARPTPPQSSPDARKDAPSSAAPLTAATPTPRRTNRESRGRAPCTPPSRHSPLFPCLPCLNDGGKHPTNASPPSSEEGASSAGGGTGPPAGPPAVPSPGEKRAERTGLLQGAGSPGAARQQRANGGSHLGPPPARGRGTRDDASPASSSLPATGHNDHHGRLPYVFTRNPAELQGDIIHSSLVKSARGFGFTIVGADENDSEEFLQIKSIVPNGPAWADRKLRTGDVLVYVNGVCVLGYTHQGVVSLFQSISPGEMVHLQVCRGYSLPFDPDDPNTEIVTTMAVSSPDASVSLHSRRPDDYQDIYSSKSLEELDGGESRTRPAKSMPDLSGSERPRSLPQRHNSADLLAPGGGPDILDFGASSPVGGKPGQPPQFITVEIVKGTSGFGFTIADSAYGQKVKKILDEPRCQGLQEGDILAEIEGRDVRGRLHTEVVQALKDCPVGQGARITVHRGRHTAASPAKVKARAAKVRPSEDFLSKGSNSTFSHFALKSYHSEGYVPAYQGQYRSKTPTAELYSSRDKEAVVVSRPKTPLVDTRHWTSSEQHSPADDAHPNNNSSVDEAGLAPATTASSPAKPPRTGLQTTDCITRSIPASSCDRQGQQTTDCVIYSLHLSGDGARSYKNR